jgi:hypothetical protein
VDEKPAPFSVSLSKVKFGNHGNQTTLVWQLKPYLCNSGYHSWTCCLTTATMVDYVTMEAKTQVVVAADKLLINNMRKVGYLVLY